MARWRLTAPHYLNVKGIEWDYVEQDQKTGRNKRQHFAVPLHLDPNDAMDHNDKANEWIVVSDGNNAGPRDIIFIGQPTPDMAPLDEEAEKISAALLHKWDHPIESLAGTYQESLLATFQKQVDDKLKELGGLPQAGQYAKGVDPAAFEALQKQVAELVSQNTQLIAMLQQQLNPLMKVEAAPKPELVDERRA